MVILSVQPMFQFHRLLWDLESIDASSNTLKVVPQRVSPSEVKLNQANELFAPRDHWYSSILRSYVELGFMTLHYAIGCLPKNVILVHQPA